MIKRQRLGNTYTRSPADETKAWFAVNLNKIFFTLFISLCYFGILWVGIKIVVFLGVNVATVWEAGDIDVNEVYAGPYGILFKILGVLGILIYVFKDKATKR